MGRVPSDATSESLTSSGSATHLRADEPGADTGTAELPRRFSRSTQEEVDPQLIRETRNQIQGLVQEIRELADSDCDRLAFFEGFLARVTSALASTAGAIWTRDADGRLRLEYQVNFPETGLKGNEPGQIAHGQLLERLLAQGQPTLVPPHAGAQDAGHAGADSGDAQDTGSPGTGESSNPTQHLLVVGVLNRGDQAEGLVEIFQRPGGGPTTQRGYLRFLDQMCEVASGFLKNERLKEFATERETWSQLRDFVRQVHNGLDTRQTLYTLANESRRFCGCDRVSVALKQGQRCQVQSISGLDTIERRAEHVKLLNRLIQATTRTGTPLWYGGETENLPPQIESRLQDYLDLAHSKVVAIVPLFEVPPTRPAGEQVERGPGAAARKRLIGAAVFEQLAESGLDAALKRRIEITAEHGSDALSNALSHSSIFLMPLWKALGHVPGVQTARRLPAVLLVGLILAAAIFALVTVPYEFTLGSTGKLVPGESHEVFAPFDGQLIEVNVPEDPLAMVEQDQVLAIMSNSDLEVKIKGLLGERDAELEQQKKLFHATMDKTLSRTEAEELQGEILKSQIRQRSIERKLQLRYADLEKLEVRAPARGRVANWQLRQNLLRRPVKTGHHLMTIVDPDTAWELELELPERRLSHLLEHQSQNASDPVQATFTLASQPDVRYTGRIEKIDRQLDVYSDSGNAVLVRVAFDNSQVPAELLRSGTRVTCKIHCGERSSGYVLFHELIETVQAKVLFWF